MLRFILNFSWTCGGEECLLSKMISCWILLRKMGLTAKNFMYCYEQKYNYLISLLLYCSLHFFQNVAVQWTNNNNSGIMMNETVLLVSGCPYVRLAFHCHSSGAVLIMYCYSFIVYAIRKCPTMLETLKFANWHAKNKGKAPYKRLPRGSICRTRDGDQVDRHLPLL